MKTSKLNPALASLKEIRKALQTSSQSEPTPAETAKRTPKSSLRFSLEPRSSIRYALNSTDQALFKEAVRGTTPLRNKNTHPISKPSKHTTSNTKEQRLQRQRHASGNEELLEIYGLSDEFTFDFHEQPLSEYLNPQCGPDVLRQLKKSRWPISNHIDLHGSTLDQARLRLNYFLKYSLIEQYKCVRIVHGKGYGSKDRTPILALTVRRWLSQLDFVQAFCDCAPYEGGEGAVKVLLRLTTPYS